MGGSSSSEEIEDILSSIRRLVSEDLRPAVRASAQSQTDKLLLTPALRVVSSRPKAEVIAAHWTAPPQLHPVAEAGTPLPRLHLGVDHEVTRPTQDLVASVAQGVDQGSRLDWESETGDPEPDVDSLDWSSFTFARRSPQETFSAQVMAASAVPPAGWAQPDPGEPAAAETAPQEAPEVEMYWVEEGEEQLSEAEAAAAPDLAEQPVARDGAEVLPGSQQEEDNIFSEQVLRELVRDLIREQLQGDLGERITRNIRKMVRAEISQALSVSKLD